MELLLVVIVSTLLAGLAMPLGALLASFENIKTQWLEDELRHSVLAFGGGALLSAVALVLVPDGIKFLQPTSAALFFVVGGLAFMLLDIYLKRKDTPASQLSIMLSDFIPESIALGAAFSMTTSSVNSSAYLLAGLIALQNLPEGFNAYRELKDSAVFKSSKIITLFILMAFLGPLAGVSGFLLLADYPIIVSGIMLFAAGGIMYSVFQDIAPHVKLDKHWAPPMGAVLGFVVGIIGYMLAHD